MSSKRFISQTSLIAVALGLFMTSGTAQSQSTATAVNPAANTAVNPDGVVAVGGVSILTIRFPEAGMSVRQRADAVTARLRAILADPTLRPSDIVAVPMGRNAATIMVKNHLLVTVEAETARFNSDTPMELAQTWVTHLRVVLPQINVHAGRDGLAAMGASIRRTWICTTFSMLLLPEQMMASRR